MKKFVNFLFISLVAGHLYACNSNNGNKESSEVLEVPAFPYQTYLDSIGEDEWFPNIGDDGAGFEAISDNIRYPNMPEALSSSQFADSLLQFYNMTIAINTVAYDISTAERYMNEPDFEPEQADALDAINVSGIHEPEIKAALVKLSRNAAKLIRDGKKPNKQRSDEIAEFYEKFDAFVKPLIDAHITDDEFDPSEILEDYADIHSKAISDTTTFRSELLQRVLRESDFGKKCVLAREYAYANYNSPYRDDMELVAVIDPILRADKYSPLLFDLWLMWRTALQKDILSGPSNDSAMYNLFYNDIRNRIILVYIEYLNGHPEDKLAFSKFARLAMKNNITRNSNNYGNNSIIDEMRLYDEIVNK